MTILEATLAVLKQRGELMTVKEIFDEIVARDLYTFRAKNPRSVLSGTLRTHIKDSAKPQLVEVRSGVYEARFD